MEEKLKGKKIAFTTTNGTQAIAKAIEAREIIIGSFLNLSAVTSHLLESNNKVLYWCAQDGKEKSTLRIRCLPAPLWTK